MLTKVRKEMHEQNENLNKEAKYIKRQQTFRNHIPEEYNNCTGKINREVQQQTELEGRISGFEGKQIPSNQRRKGKKNEQESR